MSWNNVIGFAGRLVFDAPFAFACWIARAVDFIVLVVPVAVAKERRVIEFAYQVVARRAMCSPTRKKTLGLILARASPCVRDPYWVVCIMNIRGR